jgi:putative transposase
VPRDRPGSGGIRHQGRSSIRIAAAQYASNDYRKLLRDWHMESSMRRKGDCRDNAVTETLFGTRLQAKGDAEQGQGQSHFPEDTGY